MLLMQERRETELTGASLITRLRTCGGVFVARYENGDPEATTHFKGVVYLLDALHSLFLPCR